MKLSTFIGRLKVYVKGLSKSFGTLVESLASVRLRVESSFSLVLASRFLRLLGVAKLEDVGASCLKD